MLIIDSNRLYIDITDVLSLTGREEDLEKHVKANGLHLLIHLLTVLSSQVLFKPITEHINSNEKKKKTTTQKDATFICTEVVLKDISTRIGQAVET